MEQLSITPIKPTIAFALMALLYGSLLAVHANRALAEEYTCTVKQYQDPKNPDRAGWIVLEKAGTTLIVHVGNDNSYQAIYTKAHGEKSWGAMGAAAWLRIGNKWQDAMNSANNHCREWQKEKAPPVKPKDRDLGDEECARMRREVIGGTMKGGAVGVVIAQMGDTELHYCGGGVGPLVKGSIIKIGDCVKTGPKGLVRIQMADRDEMRNAGPSVINVASNSEMCFKKFLASFDDPPKQETAFELIKGIIHKIINGWGRNSSVSVKTGATSIGIRGSEVVISYDPNRERVEAYVVDGLMDVTNSKTGATKSLTNNQKVVVSNGSIGNIEPLSKMEWDSVLSRNGLDLGSTSGSRTAVEFEKGYDRPGGELIRNYTDVPSAQYCFDLCSRDVNCAAFTWVKPNIQGPTGMCWLKGSLSRRVRNDCCVSGVVKAVREDLCESRKTGTTYSCSCQNSITRQWYITNPGACP